MNLISLSLFELTEIMFNLSKLSNPCIWGGKMEVLENRSPFLLDWLKDNEVEQYMQLFCYNYNSLSIAVY